MNGRCSEGHCTAPVDMPAAASAAFCAAAASPASFSTCTRKGRLRGHGGCGGGGGSTLEQLRRWREAEVLAGSRGGGWVPSGLASCWEGPAAWGRQAQPEGVASYPPWAAAGAELGRCRGGLTV